MKKTNKAKKSRKSMMFSAGMAMTLLIVLLRVFFLVFARRAEFTGEFAIGANQLSMFEAIQNADRATLYGEEGFSLAMQQALHDTAANGGYAESPSCGMHNKYILWRKSSSEECYPDERMIKEQAAMVAFGHLEDIAGYENSHDIFIEQKGDRTIARAYALVPTRQGIICHYGTPPLLEFEWSIINIPMHTRISNPFGSEITGACGRYYYRQSFVKDIDFEIDELAEISRQARRISDDVEDCMAERSAALLAERSAALCMREKISEASQTSDFEWELCEAAQEGAREFAICVNTGKKAITFNEVGAYAEIKDIVLKFALAFPEEAPETPPAEEAAEPDAEETEEGTETA